MNCNNDEKNVESLDLVYFFNDVPITVLENYGQDKKLYNKNKKKIIPEASKVLSNLGKLFSAKSVCLLEYNFVLFNLQMKIKNCINKEYDLVIALGNKGKTLLETLKGSIKYKDFFMLPIKRGLVDKNLNTMDLNFIVNESIVKDKYDFSSKKDLKILIIDDIVYSGGTIKKAIEVLNLSDYNIDVVTLLCFEEALEQKKIDFYAGVYIEKGTWPNNNQDLWCLRDLVESDAVTFMDKTSTSFLEQKEFMTKYVFGDKYEAAVCEVQKLISVMNDAKENKDGN